MKRRSLSSAHDLAPQPGLSQVLPMRRGGARHELTERVRLQAATTSGAAAEPLEGWALNISRGGVRVILEASVELGAEFEVTIGEDDPQLSTRGRIVWIQEEPDGVIVGVEFLGLSGTHRSPPFEPGTVPPPPS